MIQENELRIGNWVELHGEFLQVFSIENKSTATHSKVELQLDSESLDKHIKGVNIRDIKPIHLSEEILLKFGFEKDIDDLVLQIGNVILFIKYNDDELVYCMNMALDIIVSFKHLHQLQNLFFALTGKELEVKI